NGAMVLYLNPDTSNPAIGRIIHCDLKFMDHSLKLSGYVKICQRALEFVALKLEKLSSSYNKEVNSMDLNDLYKQAKTPNRNDFEFQNENEDMRQTRGPHTLRD